MYFNGFKDPLRYISPTDILRQSTNTIKRDSISLKDICKINYKLKEKDYTHTHTHTHTCIKTYLQYLQ